MSFRYEMKQILWRKTDDSMKKISECNQWGEKYDLIVNASSIGLKNEVSPISTKYIEKDSIVYEIVYRPIYTNLVLNAKKVNARIIYGYEMLVEQGAKAFEIWTGSKAPIKTMKQSLLGVFGEPKWLQPLIRLQFMGRFPLWTLSQLEKVQH